MKSRHYAKGDGGKKRVLYFIEILLCAYEVREKEQTQDSSQLEVTLTRKDKRLCVSGVGEKGTSNEDLDNLIQMHQDCIPEDRMEFYKKGKSIYKSSKKSSEEKVELQGVFDFLNKEEKTKRFYTKHDPTPYDSKYCRKFDLILKGKEYSIEENLRYVADKLGLHLPSNFLPIAETDDKSKDLNELNRQDLFDSESVKRRPPEEAKPSTPKSGILVQAPPLPGHFVDRPKVSQDLKKQLIAESTDRFGTLVISAIHGLGGIGKTILAQALAHDPQVQERFYDGVLWATLGQQPDVLSLLQNWIAALKDYSYKPTTIQAASNHLNSLLYDKAILLIIDDAWNIGDIEPFRVGGGKCQAIITTRRSEVARKVDAYLYPLDLMSEAQSLMLLEKRLNKSLEDTEKEVAKKLVKTLGYLPLALNLAASRIAEGETWIDLYNALTEEIDRLKVLESEENEFKIVKSEDRNTSVEACFNLSLKALKQKYEPKIWTSFVWLGVLPEDVNITAPMISTLWEVEIVKAKKILKILGNNALLLLGESVRIGQEKCKTYRIHDLLHDLAIKRLTEEKILGLGLTIPEAHRILLERYHNRLNGEKWHELADDGYIHEHLTWHMEKAGRVEKIYQLLQEETDTRKNAWHLICESLGKPAIFVGDVARAWKLAELEYDSNPGRALGLQCRYALIISSLNTIAVNIPPELISVLIDKKVWTPAQGLAYSRQVESLSQRVKALIFIAPHLPEIRSEALKVARSIGNKSSKVEALSKIAPYLPEIWSEALDLVRNIDENRNRRVNSNKAEALISIATHLPASLLPQALDLVRNLRNENDKANALISIAPHLLESLLPQALDLVRNLRNGIGQAKALSSLAPHLPESLLPQALEDAQNIEDESSRAKALSSIAPHLPENLFLQALEDAQNIKDKYSRAIVLISFAPYLPEIWSKALEAIKNIENEHHRAGVLSKIAPHLPEFWFEALEAIKNIENEHHRAGVLSKIAPHLPKNLLPQALEVARNIEGESRAMVLSSLAPYLPKNLFLQALKVVRNIEPIYHKTYVLTSFAPYLPKNLLPQALEDALDIKDEDHRAMVLSSLAPYLPENLFLQALKVVRNIGAEYHREDVLFSLAPHLPENLFLQALESESRRSGDLSSFALHLPESLLPQALEVFRDIGDEYSRAGILSSLASHLPEIRFKALEAIKNIENEYGRADALSSLASHLPEICFEALKAIKNIENEYGRSGVLSSLAPHLPESLLPQALEIARNIRYESSVAIALSSLAPHLPESLLPQALEIVRNIRYEYTRAGVLNSLAPHLPESLLPQALEILRNIRYESSVAIGSSVAIALSSLAPHLPESLLSQALEIARNIRYEISRVKALSSLAPHLPKIWSEALEVARNIKDEKMRAEALSSLAPHLPESLLPQALKVARNIKDSSSRAIVLISLASRLPKIRSEALEVARNIENEYGRADALSSLAPHLPKIWSEVLEAIKNIKHDFSRARLLKSIAPYLPKSLLPQALEVARNILEVARNTKNISDQSLLLGSITPYLPEIRSKVLEALGDIENEYRRADVLNSLVPNVDKIFASFPYDFWCELIHFLASLKRRELLRQIGDNSNIIKELGSSETFREIADAVENVGRWFP